MTRSRAFARITLGSARWLLPWIAVLLVSVTLAYAMSSAVHGGASATDQQPDVQAAASTAERTTAAPLEQPTTSLATTSAKLDRSTVAEPCSGIGSGLPHVGVDWWIVAEGQTVVCNRAMAPSRGTFGVMSTTSPASTGHSSSNGCCTWD
jgi:hypothetical protein